MYKVSTIITPINYIVGFPKAMKDLNQQRAIELQDLDLMILAILEQAKMGLRNRGIMKALYGRVHMPKFVRSLNKLMEEECITQVKYRKSVFYTITLEGKRTLQSFLHSFEKEISA